MGMFGRSSRFDPTQGGISMKDRAAIFMAALNGDTSGAMKLKQSLQAAPAQNEVMQRIQQLMQPSVQGYVGAAGPTMDGSEPTAQAIPEGQRPSMRRDLRDPEVQRALMDAQRVGADPGLAMKLFGANAPDIAIGPGGMPYDRFDPATLKKTFRDPANINGFLVDKNNPANEGRYFPQLKDGIAPDGQGGAAAIRGYADAAASIAGRTKAAEAQATSPYDFITVPAPGGGQRVIAKSQAVGGDFVGQSPADATYGASRATAAADTMKTIQTLGQQAPTKIARYHQIDGLLGAYEGGKLSPTGLEMASALNSLGFKMSPKLQNAQAADALGKQLILDLNGGSLGTGFSNADREFLEKTIPSIQQSAGGRRQLLAIGISAAQRQQDIANKARQWEQRFGRIDAPDAAGKTFQDYVDEWSAKHSVFTPR